VEPIITSIRDEIRDALAMGFTGKVFLANGKTLTGNVTPCDIVNGEHTGSFTDITVSSVRGSAFRRVPVAAVAIVEIRDV
jgi:hypothetical protein